MINDKTQCTYSYEWNISVPIFRNFVILRQLAIAIGVPFGVIIAVLLLAGRTSNSTDSLYALGLIGGLFLLTYLFIMIVYGGNYDAGFVIDNKGILCYTQKKQAKVNRIVNWLTIILGLLSRNPAAAGAGLLAQSRQSVLLKWNRIQRVEYNPRRRVIMVKGNFTETIAVFCTEENYSEVEGLIRLRRVGKG